MQRLAGLLAIVAVALGGCDATGAETSGDIPASEAVEGTAQDAEWRLVIATPQSVWPAGAPIEVTAELHWIGAGDGTTYYASGAGPMAFSLSEQGGRRRLDGIRSGDCAVHEIRADPFVSTFVKSGGFDAADPNAAFYRAFLADPQLRLPTGRWEIRADVELYMPPAWCSGRLVQLEAAVVLDVR